jgi:mannitol/fructose-specific phosphotransferase system IIA component (Ntr-type)
MDRFKKFTDWEKKNMELNQSIQSQKEALQKLVSDMYIHKQIVKETEVLNDEMQKFKKAFETDFGVPLTDASWAALKLQAATQNRIIVP